MLDFGVKPPSICYDGVNVSKLRAEMIYFRTTTDRDLFSFNLSVSCRAAT